MCKRGSQAKAIVLVHYTPKYGPQILRVYPEGNLNDLLKAEVLGIAEQVPEEEVNADYILPGQIGLSNAVFTIPSRWSMDGYERVLISMVFESAEEMESSAEDLKPRVANIISQLKSGEDLFKAFYAAYIYSFPEEERPRIREKNAQVQEMLENFYSATLLESYHK
jgi:hypothetical protein